MDIEALALEAKSVIDNIPFGMSQEHGMEVSEGFFILYNDFTGQSKVVVYHPESEMVFKYAYASPAPVRNSSNRYLGYIEIDNKTYRIRLPKFYMIEVKDEGAYKTYINAQEYVVGEPCGCEIDFCLHSKEMVDITDCFDCHRGNWKIMDGEIILFDFEGIKLSE